MVRVRLGLQRAPGPVEVLTMQRHRTFAVVGFSAATALAIVPHATNIGWIVNTSIGAIAVCAVFAGIWINHPVRQGPWIKIGLGVGCLVLGDAVVGVYTYILHRPIPSVSPADAFYVLACIILTAAAFGLVRGAGRDPDALIDAGIALSGGAVLLWSLVLAPAAASPIPLLERILVGFYPLVDLAILAVVIRLAFARAPRPPVVWWVLGSFAALLTADAAYALLQQTSAYQVGLLDAIWLWAYIGLGAAALHPGMRAVAASRSDRSVAPLDSMRIGLVCVSLLVAPITLLVTEMRERSLGTSVISGLSVIVAVLVVLRVTRTTRSRQREEEILEYQGLHDPVTGLANRRLLMDRLEQAIARTDRSSSGVAVAFLDLDRFKEVNDTFGHATGDQLLESVAGRLSAAVRPTDTVARVGGDEFVIVCADLQGRVDAAAMGSRIMDVFSEDFPLETSQPFVTASVGVAFTDAQMSAEQLLRDADTAMYRAKDSGRNRIEFFDHGPWTEGTSRLESGRRAS